MNFCLLRCAPAKQWGFCFPVCRHIVLFGVSFLWLVFYSDSYPNYHNQIYLYIFPNILWDSHYPCLGTIAVYLFSFLFQQGRGSPASLSASLTQSFRMSSALLVGWRRLWRCRSWSKSHWLVLFPGRGIILNFPWSSVCFLFRRKIFLTDVEKNSKNILF